VLREDVAATTNHKNLERRLCQPPVVRRALDTNAALQLVPVGGGDAAATTEWSSFSFIP
jgi:hypothetical protein